MASKTKQEIRDFKERARAWNEKHPLVFDRANEFKGLALQLCLDNFHLANSGTLRRGEYKRRAIR